MEILWKHFPFAEFSFPPGGLKVLIINLKASDKEVSTVYLQTLNPKSVGIRRKIWKNSKQTQIENHRIRLKIIYLPQGTAVLV